MIPSIQKIADLGDDVVTDMKTKFAKEKNVSFPWESRNADIIDKLGYELIDYIDGDINNRETSITIRDNTIYGYMWSDVKSIQ